MVTSFLHANSENSIALPENNTEILPISGIDCGTQYLHESNKQRRAAGDMLSFAAENTGKKEFAKKIKGFGLPIGEAKKLIKASEVAALLPPGVAEKCTSTQLQTLATLKMRGALAQIQPGDTAIEVAEIIKQWRKNLKAQTPQKFRAEYFRCLEFLNLYLKKLLLLKTTTHR